MNKLQFDKATTLTVEKKSLSYSLCTLEWAKAKDGYEGII